MKRGHLSDYFRMVGGKALSAVETRPSVSNQHEFNGSKILQEMFGPDDRRDIKARFVRVDDDGDSVTADGFLSWYNARHRHPIRTEYRLYYSGNAVTDLMQEGDFFFLGLRNDGSALIVVTPGHSTVQNQLLWLFDLPQPNSRFTMQVNKGEASREIDFAARLVLEQIGIDLQEPEQELFDRLVEPFARAFPSTREFSKMARDSLPEVLPLDAPDDALVAWMEREERLFRRLEHKIVAEQLAAGFGGKGNEVDHFIAFSLSVQNRRKARAGLALENHLEELFRFHGLRFQRGVETENRNKPDFLFPGQVEYRNGLFPVERLTMLGAKSSLKDRWRQVLSEAARIERKHLLTLEPGISENQTDEMREKLLQLVVPRSVHVTYGDSQRSWLMDVSGFLKLVADRQSAA